MTNQVAHQNVDHVIVKREHAIPTINIASGTTLQRRIYTSYAPGIERGSTRVRGIKFVGIPVRNQDCAEVLHRNNGFQGRY